MIDPVLAPVRTTFRAMAIAMLPEAEELDEEGWRRAEEIIEGALADRPPGVRRQVRLFVRAAGWLSLLRHGRPLASLDAERRRAFLARLQNARLLALRRGTWGLRTLVFMGYYGQYEVQKEIGYGAELRGWRTRSRGDGQGDRDRPQEKPPDA